MKQIVTTVTLLLSDWSFLVKASDSDYTGVKHIQLTCIKIETNHKHVCEV